MSGLRWVSLGQQRTFLPPEQGQSQVQEQTIAGVQPLPPSRGTVLGPFTFIHPDAMHQHSYTQQRAPNPAGDKGAQLPRVLKG